MSRSCLLQYSLACDPKVLIICWYKSPCPIAALANGPSLLFKILSTSPDGMDLNFSPDCSKICSCYIPEWQTKQSNRCHRIYMDLLSYFHKSSLSGIIWYFCSFARVQWQLLEHKIWHQFDVILIVAFVSPELEGISGPLTAHLCPLCLLGKANIVQLSGTSLAFIHPIGIQVQREAKVYKAKTGFFLTQVCLWFLLWHSSFWKSCKKRWAQFGR